MNKKAYNELREKLKNKYTKPNKEYGVPSAVSDWLIQCGIKPHVGNLNIICWIMGSVPYPHQEADRKVILKYLKKYTYKEFKCAN